MIQVSNENPEIKEKAQNIFAIGDIHGQYKKLLKLIEKLPWNEVNDTLIFLGDYIDRGKHSRQIIQFLIELKKKNPNIVFLLGNHEQLLKDYYYSNNNYYLKLWRSFGGWNTIESYTNGAGIWGKPNFLPPSHRDFFNNLLPYYETENYIFVHAGLKENVPLKAQKMEHLIWMRKSFTSSKADFGKIVVFGHTPMKDPFVSKNKIGIDTGAGYGNKLTAVKLPETIFFQT